MPTSNMKNLLKKLHIMPNQPEDVNGLVPSKGSRLNEGSSEKMSPSRSSPSKSSPSYSEQKPFSSLSGWLSSVGNRHSPSSPSSSNVRIGEMKDFPDSVSSSGLGVVLDTTRQDSKSNNSRDPEVDEERQIQLALEMSAREDPKTFDLSISRDQEVEEEYQIQLALEISAREDPEAVQIEAVKQISLASFPPQNTPAEIIAYRYWNYDALSYDDKILDGFYDLYGILADSSSAKMPSLVDLLGTPVSDTISWEAVLVDRASDANLIKLEQKALVMTVKSRSELRDSVDTHLVQELATLVADYMGGPVGSPESMLKAWRDLSNTLRATLNSMVLPLGYLTIGLARHRALLFKVLADSVGIPCGLMKGHQYSGSDDMAVNIVRTDDISREYIIDLMANPGTLIPFDAAVTQIEYGKPFFAATPSLRDVDFTRRPSSSGVVRSIKESSEFEKSDNILSSENHGTSESDLDNRGAIDELQKVESSQESLSNAEKCEVEAKVLEDRFRFEKALVQKSPKRPSYPHARSPSWTEGISSPAVRRMKVKDVSQYMIDAAKENPDLAQKLHDVLLESGVVAPPNLFSEIYTEQRGVLLIEDKKRIVDEDRRSETRRMGEPELGTGQYSTPLPFIGVQSKASPPGDKLELKPVEGLVVGSPQNLDQLTGLPVVAVSAASTEAVVASSVVGAAVKSNTNTDVEAPVAAAAASRQSEHGVQFPSNAPGLHQIYFTRSDKNTDVSGSEPQGTSGREHVESPGAERSSHRLAGNDSTKSEIALNDVAEWEIPWEEITLGERIGLGSCGEVYRGDWHETEVAVKKFLNQDISGDALEEFISEVRIMKRLRHPNVVLFMGAVTHAPNLSIVTEFLPRGSLYRLIHRPNSQLDERRRLRMALDVARGMNYLHNCTPVIVHRDLKSPNLLVDKNWVVKVSDFGLSRMKHNTFLSSRSTAGTAEWMAPEVLRNEPSDEKCDVYSFGVILWELSTLQQPWGGLNPMQVVGAVGFQHRRLDIPGDMDPAIAEIVIKCWQTDPRLRPSFSEIMAVLKPLQKPVTSAQVPRPKVSTNTGPKKENV